MFSSIEEFLKLKVDEVVFVELKEGVNHKFEGGALDATTPIPLMLEDVVDKVKGIQAEDINTHNIVKGMVFILGVDGKFPYKEKYMSFINALDEDINKFILSHGFKFAEDEKFEEAMIYFKAANEFYPDNLDILYNYGRCVEEMSQKVEEKYEKLLTKEAFEVFSYLNEKFEDNPLSYYHLGFHYSNMKEYKKAEHMWTTALRIGVDEEKKMEIVQCLQDIDAKVKFEQAYNYVLSGRTDEGLEILHTLEDAYSDWWNLMFFIGLAYRQQEKYDEAIKYFLKTLALNTGHVDTFNEIGLCYMTTGDFNSALKYFKEALKVDINNPEILCNLGIVYIQTGEYDLAYESLSKSLSLNPDDEITTAWIKHLNQLMV